MPDFYYQIKGKYHPDDPHREDGLYGGITNWVYPPIFSGKVTAADKKEAQKLIEEDYGKKFSTRVLKKDLATTDFLLSVNEITPDGKYTMTLFEERECSICKRPFTLIEKYNDSNNGNNSYEYCSQSCQNEYYEIRKLTYAQERANALERDEVSGSKHPLIYKITNRSDGDKCYIGKTTQVFTLRWYQHFFQGGKNKFHEAIKKSKVSDWVFEIIEIIEFPKEFTRAEEYESYILERETYWMNKCNSISNGYNSQPSIAGDINQLEIPVE